MARPKEFDVEDALEAAMEAFWERGYAATSVADLTRAMGVQKASLYATYGDKRRLFLAALERYAAREARDLEGALAVPDVREAIRGVFRAEASCGDPRAARRGCFVVNAIAEVAPHDDAAAALLRRHVERSEAAFARALERGCRQGALRSDLEPAAAARILVSALYGLAVLKKLDPLDPRVAGTAEAAASLLRR